MGFNFYCGIDVGRQGAIALLSDNGLVARVWDMPPESERGVDLDGLLAICKDIPHCPIGLEWNTARPGEVPDFAFRFGLQTGQIDGILQASGYKVTHISPRTWKPRLGLTGKAADPGSVYAASYFDRLYPRHRALIYGPRGGLLDGRLDAFLIAHYLLLNSTSPVGNKGGRRPPTFKGLTGDQLTTD